MAFAFLAVPLPSSCRPSPRCESHWHRPRTGTVVHMSAASTPDSAESAESSSWSSVPDRLRNWREVRARLVASEARGSALHVPIGPLPASPAVDALLDGADRGGDERGGADLAVDVRWAHPLAQVEVGACLLARAGHVWPKAADYLRYAVILVTDVDPVAGIQGLLLNRPTGRTVATSASVFARVGPEFSDNVVHLGGDSCMGYLEVLHARREVDGAREVMPGLYRGGVNACRALVAKRQASPFDFHVMISYAQWTWQQFADELALYAWDMAAVSPNLLLPSSHDNPGYEPKRHWDMIHRELRRKR